MSEGAPFGRPLLMGRNLYLQELSVSGFSAFYRFCQANEGFFAPAEAVSGFYAECLSQNAQLPNSGWWSVHHRERGHWLGLAWLGLEEGEPRIYLCLPLASGKWAAEVAWAMEAYAQEELGLSAPKIAVLSAIGQ